MKLTKQKIDIINKLVEEMDISEFDKEDIKQECYLSILEAKSNRSIKYIVDLAVEKIICNDIPIVFVKKELPNISSVIDQKIDRIVIEDVLSTLTQREQMVIKYRYFDKLKYQEIGNMFHVNRERIRQIEAKALRKLAHSSRKKLLLGWIDDEQPKPKNDLPRRVRLANGCGAYLNMQDKLVSFIDNIVSVDTTIMISRHDREILVMLSKSLGYVLQYNTDKDELFIYPCIMEDDVLSPYTNIPIISLDSPFRPGFKDAMIKYMKNIRNKLDWTQIKLLESLNFKEETDD